MVTWIYRSVLTGLLIMAITGSDPVFAGEDADNETWGETRSCNTCYRGRPIDECCTFSIVETALRWRTGGHNIQEYEEHVIFSLDLGLMYNINRRSAFGGSIYIAGNGEARRFGIVPRYRYWVHPEFSFDLKAGVLMAGDADRDEWHMPGFVGGVSVSMLDLLSFDLLVETYRVERIPLLQPGPGEPAKRHTERSTVLYLGASTRTSAAWVIPSGLIVLAILSVGDHSVQF